MPLGNQIYKELKHVLEAKGKQLTIITACEELEVNEDLRIRIIEVLEGGF